ncbi:MAG: hypothetical protein K1X67_07985 [Fimbriimonadaceae bacterium]|nr:hypothetical protein [Fimbriimonadaceae bacterium]
MKQLLSILSLTAVCLSAAQDIGGAWFIERGRSQPVVLVPVGRVDDVFGLSWLDLDLSLMGRPVDGVRLGGALTFSTPIARNAWAKLGIGGLVGETFEWSAVRPGLVLGLTVRF